MRAPMERMSKQVQRFVDVSGLNKIAQGFASIGRAAASVLRTLVEIIPVLGTITGAATIAGMAKLVESYSKWSQALTSTADNLGMTTQQLQQFQDATRLAGGNANDMTEAMKAFYKVQTDFVRGQAGPEAIGWLNRLGINIKDANGHLRNMADIMPEVIQKIADIKNPADRAAASAALLGDANSNLVETFRRSHQSFGQWMTDASRYTELTDKQKDQLQSFAEAQGRVATAFDHLGQQIAATLANNFTPLMNKLAEFVEKRSPEIIAAVDRISQQFAAWLSNINWDHVQQGIDKFIQSLGWVVDHLDEIKVAAEIVAGIFVTKWAIGMVGDIGKVVTALGSPGAAGTGGTGLLGSLALAGTLATAAFLAWQKAKDPATYDPKNLAPNSPFWRGMDESQKPPPPAAGPSFSQSPSGWLANRLGFPGANLGGAGRLLDRAIKGPESVQPLGPAGGKGAFYDEQRQLIYDAAKRAGVAHPEVVAEVGATQAQLESGGGAHTPGGFNVYGIKSGGGVGTAGAPVSTQEEGAGGRYTTQASFAQFKSKEDAADAYIDFLKKNPRHYQGVLDADTVAKGLHAQGTSGYATASNYESSLFSVNKAYGGAPAATVPPASSGNGKVDVAITGKNLPPDSAVTAQGSGAVNVAPPRVEYQNFSTV